MLNSIFISGSENIRDILVLSYILMKKSCPVPPQFLVATRTITECSGKSNQAVSLCWDCIPQQRRWTGLIFLSVARVILAPKTVVKEEQSFDVFQVPCIDRVER